jgi:hypothetical protein
MIVSVARIFDELIECPANLFALYIPNSEEKSRKRLKDTVELPVAISISAMHHLHQKDLLICFASATSTRLVTS